MTVEQLEALWRTGFETFGGRPPLLVAFHRPGARLKKKDGKWRAAGPPAYEVWVARVAGEPYAEGNAELVDRLVHDGDWVLWSGEELAVLGKDWLGPDGRPIVSVEHGYGARPGPGVVAHYVTLKP